MAKDSNTDATRIGQKVSSIPSISLPKGGGAVRGIGEKFAANPVTGTGSISVPIAASPGRSGFGPTLSLSYDLNLFIQDAVKNQPNTIQSSWYLTNIFTGFEIWRGGVNLESTSFCALVN